MLPRARLGDDAPLPHAHRQQRLSERVVDLVRSRVREVLTFDVDPCAAEIAREVSCEVEWGGAADVLIEEFRKLALEFRIDDRARILSRQFLDGGHQCLGHECAAVWAESSRVIGHQMPPRAAPDRVAAIPRSAR